MGRTASGPIVINGQSNVTISGLQFQNLGSSQPNAIVIQNSSNVTVTANDFDNVIGAILAIDSSNITVTWNRYRNIGDGTIGFGHSNFVQFGRTTGGYIANNKGIGGNTEDIISMYQSQGASASSPIVIEYNHFEGTTWTSGSGSGMMLGDSGGAHIVARFNTLLNPGQVGIGIPGGSDIHVTDNIIYGAQRSLSNVGNFVYNYSACSNEEVSRNQVKWYRFDGVENAMSDAGTCGVVTFADNNWSAPLDPVTLRVTL